jgi:DNA-binding response OmpR family regulator
MARDRQDGFSEVHMKILIANNNNNLSFVLKSELEEEGYSVDSVTNGIDAVNRVIDQSDYAFLLIDVLLPKLDGLDALKLVRKIRPKMNIIAVSEPQLYGGQDECLSAGADIYFPKPYKLDKIKNYIDTQTKKKKTRVPVGR